MTSTREFKLSLVTLTPRTTGELRSGWVTNESKTWLTRFPRVGTSMFFRSETERVSTEYLTHENTSGRAERLGILPRRIKTKPDKPATKPATSRSLSRNPMRQYQLRIFDSKCQFYSSDFHKYQQAMVR